MATPATGEPPPRARRMIEHAADPSRLERKSGPSPCARLGRPSGTPGWPPCSTQSQLEPRRASSCSGKRGRPPLGPLRPFPPRSPLPRLPRHLANSHPLPPMLGNRFSPSSS